MTLLPLEGPQASLVDSYKNLAYRWQFMAVGREGELPGITDCESASHHVTDGLSPPQWCSPMAKVCHSTPSVLALRITSHICLPHSLLPIRLGVSPVFNGRLLALQRREETGTCYSQCP
ncbi:uncharacterized protein [Oryctolagus cuniculus]|uniref:uncharacterized protein isoform X4 n=1 Tax=Oryctolagus cuniculus TaxID=9986 RepID=UPI00048C4435|nr:uncharacterized protein LOC103347661 isoform X4 [Oryctolagus cuniculus]